MKSILIAASLLCIATWISAQEVTGLPDETTTSSSDVPEITSTVPEQPSSTTTTEEPTTTTESSHNEYCFNGGNVSCSCPPGFTGKRCESLVDWCNTTTVHENGQEITVSLCGPHGTCHYNQYSGSYCVCDAGWTGKFCDIPIPDQVIISTRCHFYYGAANPNPDCTIGSRCLPDKLNCGFVPCSAPDNIGWCLPIPTHNKIMAAFMALRPIGLRT